jgi:hypothetical protein
MRPHRSTWEAGDRAGGGGHLIWGEAELAGLPDHVHFQENRQRLLGPMGKNLGQMERIHAVDYIKELQSCLCLIGLKVAYQVPGDGQAAQGVDLGRRLLHPVLADVGDSGDYGLVDGRRRKALAHPYDGDIGGRGVQRARRRADPLPYVGDPSAMATTDIPRGMIARRPSGGARCGRVRGFGLGGLVS